MKKKKRPGPIIDAQAGTRGDRTPREMQMRGERGRSGTTPPMKSGKPGRFGDTSPKGECVGDTAPPKRGAQWITKKKASKRAKRPAIEYAPVKPKGKK